MTRKEIYKRILERALAEIYAELEEMEVHMYNLLENRNKSFQILKNLWIIWLKKELTLMDYQKKI